MFVYANNTEAYALIVWAGKLSLGFRCYFHKYVMLGYMYTIHFFHHHQEGCDFSQKLSFRFLRIFDFQNNTDKIHEVNQTCFILMLKIATNMPKIERISTKIYIIIRNDCADFTEYEIISTVDQIFGDE